MSESAFLPRKYKINPDKQLVKIGDVFGDLTVINEPFHKEFAKLHNNRKYREKRQFVDCLCVCGNKVKSCQVNKLKLGSLKKCKQCLSLQTSKRFRKGSLSDGKQKICCKCLISKDINQFSKDKSKTDNLTGVCKTCVYFNGIQYKYNVNLEDYIKERGCKCEICGIELIIFDRSNQIKTQSSHVDHNHKTGKFRGLLCKPCNVALGEARENVEILQKMIVYLNERN